MNDRLPKFKAGDLVAARDWNTIAGAVNRIWETQAGPGLVLRKGSRWRIRKSSRSFPVPACDAGGFNAPAHKVYVWRGDKWDFGSSQPPLAFFVGGEFTAWGAQSTVRIAKFVETVDCELNTIGPDTSWQAINQFGISDGTDKGIVYLGTTKGATPYLLAGSLAGIQRNAVGAYNVAWLIDWDTGELHPSWTPITGAQVGPGISFGSCLNLCASDNYVFASRFVNMVSSRISSPGLGGGATGVNIHNAIGVEDGIFLSSRRELTPDTNLYGPEPRGIAYLKNDLTVDSTFDAGAGTGSEADNFTMCAVTKESWDNATDDDHIIWVVQSLEFSGTAYTWNGAFAFSDPTSFSCVVPILRGGQIHPGVSLASHLAVTAGGRATLFSAEEDGVWFGGSMTSVSSFGVGPIAVTANNTLCRYNPLTNEIDYFEFNGTVRDCKHFSDGQMIVVGDFTEYISNNGTPVSHACSYMAFLNQSGEFLSQLTWP